MSLEEIEQMHAVGATAVHGTTATSSNKIHFEGKFDAGWYRLRVYIAIQTTSPDDLSQSTSDSAGVIKLLTPEQETPVGTYENPPFYLKEKEDASNIQSKSYEDEFQFELSHKDLNLNRVTFRIERGITTLNCFLKVSFIAIYYCIFFLVNSLFLSFTAALILLFYNCFVRFFFCPFITK